MIRSNLNNKTFFLLKIILIYLICCLKSYSDNINSQDNLIVLGSDEASIKIKRKYGAAQFELGYAEMNLCNKVAAKDAFSVAKRDRNYRKVAGDYLKPDNFEYYTKHCE